MIPLRFDRDGSRWTAHHDLHRVFERNDEVHKQWWAVVGPLGALQYLEVVLPDDLPPETIGILGEGYPDGRLTADIGWHLFREPVSQYDTVSNDCHLGGGPCWYVSLSGFFAKELRRTLDTKGQEALWLQLEETYLTSLVELPDGRLMLL